MSDKPVTPNFEKRGGIIVVVVQDSATREVLVQAYMNEEAWDKTLSTRGVVLWSTTQQALRVKRMRVVEVWLDCDFDCALIKVKVLGDGNACHMGQPTCLHNKVQI